MTGKGRRHELDTVRAINGAVDSKKVFAATLDYSGIASDSAADIVLSWPKTMDHTDLHLVELKKRTGEDGKRVPTHPLQGSSEDESGLDELRRLIDSTPRWGHPWVCVKFDHRELVVLHADSLHKAVCGGHRNRLLPPWDYDPQEVLEATEPRLTPAENVSMKKPSLEDWPSSQGGRSDVDVLLDVLDCPEYCRAPDEGSAPQEGVA